MCVSGLSIKSCPNEDRILELNTISVFKERILLKCVDNCIKSIFI